MINKSLSFTAIILVIGMLNAENYSPFFKGNYIKVVAKSLKCGSFAIKPKKGVTDVISLEAYKFNSDKRIKKTGSLEKLPNDGRIFRYDWAGSSAQDHYRIFCKTKKSSSVSCSEVVDILYTLHNKDCIDSSRAFGVGTNAAEGYKDLNMNQG